jgi:hypothetical protein
MTNQSAALGDWSYGLDLEQAAASTLKEAEAFAQRTRDAVTRSGLPALRRLVHNLPQLRRRLLDFELLPRTLIHGDVHPGNVVVRTRGRIDDPLLLDWARARLGSPLEDVSSWLQWLGFWEHGVLRKHDTLLTGYLRARGVSVPLCSAVRDAYWLAGAINCCSGALSYHLSVACDPRVTLRQRSTALRAVHHCFRIVCRADRGSNSSTRSLPRPSLQSAHQEAGRTDTPRPFPHSIRAH